MTNELTWLARHIHAFEDGKNFVQVSGDVYFYREKPLEGVSFLREEWLARRAELQNKPNWDEAPEWAEWLAQDEDGDWRWHEDEPTERCTLYFSNSGGYMMQCKGEVLGDWRGTLERRPRDLSESAVTARLAEATDNVLAAVPALKSEELRFERNDWFERGELPPVGVDCIFDAGGGACYFSEDELRASGKAVTVIAHTKYNHATSSVAVFRWDLDGCFGVSTGNAMSFRPLPTEREKVVEEMMGLAAENWGNLQDFCERLYDAGYRKHG